jgi:hypothetical protein
MTDEERDLITRFIQRIAGAPGGGTVPGGGAAPSGSGGSVPATTSGGPPPAPIDRDADALIADLFTRYPEARYRIAQTAFVQEHALVEAQNVINRLQWELQQGKQAQAAPAASPWGAAAQPQQSRGFFGGLFGGGQQQAAPSPPPQYAPPPPQYAPGYQPGMFQRQGSGFLGSALSTAAGVAGGVLAGEALMNLFSGNHGGWGGGGFGGGAPGGFIPEAAASPWGAPAAATAVDPYDVGGAQKDSSDTGWTGGGGQPSGGDSGWQDTSAAPTDSGWQDASAAQPDTDDSSWTDTSSSDFGSNNC